jgi:carbamoylphosphate synthase large subunit
MQITIDISGDLEQRLSPHLGSLSQRALEIIVVEAYRDRLITAAEVQQTLNLPSRLATDALLKQHNVTLPLTPEEIDQDIQAIDRVLFKP